MTSEGLCVLLCSGEGVTVTFTPATPSASEERGEGGGSAQENTSFLSSTEGQLSVVFSELNPQVFRTGDQRTNQLSL